MELLVTQQHFILKNGQHTLWCPRIVQGPQLLPRIGLEIGSEAKCLGVVYGLFGLFDHNKLILIQDREIAGELPGPEGRVDEVYKITKVVVIDLGTDDENTDFGLDSCPYHGQLQQHTPKRNLNSVQQKSEQAVQQTWNHIKSATSHVKAGQGGVVSSTDGNIVSRIDPRERLEKKLIEEIYRMVNATESFYFSLTCDLTNTVQRRTRNVLEKKSSKFDELDDRFFWNKVMISSLLDCPDDMKDVSSYWIVPILQGYFESGTCTLSLDSGQEVESTLIIISRRSRFRAGTRYKRRGVDEGGKCANYVETEQILKYDSHILSFVQVRGSIPIYWSQSGHSYRPPPVLERTPEESFDAFKEHFIKELSNYGSMSIVNLVETNGRESVLGDAYLNNILLLDNEKLTYIAFDFHDYCRGMTFENVSILMESIHEMITNMKYTWIDNQGFICEQSGVFRVNCVDCLDRTNVVQTAIARTVLDLQLTRLGLLQPNDQLPPKFRRMFQTMWANNGDTISRQYAGTAALKSDFTRTGERKFAGMVKDSYNSATRYYKNRFRDAFRQAAIDVMTAGLPVSDLDLHSPDEVDIPDIHEDKDHHERVRQVIEDCKRYLVPENEVILGGWPLVDADSPGNQYSNDMDTVLILTKDCYFVAEYDDHTDRISRYQRVGLEDLEKIEFGPLPGSLLSSRLGSKKSRSSYCIRFFYLVGGQSGYFHMFRPTVTRFFNNMVIPIRTPEEEMESLKAICESFKVALSVKSLSVPVFEGKLEKKRNKNVIFGPSIAGSLTMGLEMARNVSDKNIIKNVGKSALSQFARFKGKFGGGGQNVTPVVINEPKTSSSDQDEGSGDDESMYSCNQIDVSSISNLSVFTKNQESDGSDASELEEDNGRQSTPLVIDPNGPVSLPVDVNDGRVNEDESDAILESCGIINIGPRRLSSESPVSKTPVLQEVDDFVMDSIKKAGLKHLRRKASESETPKDEHIQFQANLCDTEDMTRSLQHLEPFCPSTTCSMSTSCATLAQPIGIGFNQGMNHSNLVPAAVIGSSMKNSRSEAEMFGLHLPELTSPGALKKDLVMSPLSRIAKGVQNFGQHLRHGSPNRTQQHRVVTNLDPVAYQELQEKKKLCRSKIIEL